MPELASLDMDLSGQLLIAMPGIGDPRFDRSVIYMCAHSDDAAMGLIVNKPTSDVTLGGVLDQLDITAHASVARKTAYFGGPVETGRGFVLHGDDYESALQSISPSPGIRMTATIDILEDIARGSGPAQARLYLGYAGWGARQLETEIASNGWLTAPARHEIVFHPDAGKMWELALESLGVSPFGLSGNAGRA